MTRKQKVGGSRSKRRPYHSPLRERQAARTRELILEALAAVIVEGGTGDFSVDEVAERAGVATRTVYRHFPNRQALLDGLTDLIDERMAEARREEGGFDLRELVSREELLAALPWVFERFEHFEPFTTAVVMTSAGGRLRSRAHEARTQLFRAVLAEDLAAMDSAQAAGIFAVCRHLISPETWSVLHHEFGLESRFAGEVVAYAVSAVLNGAGPGGFSGKRD